jgi:hypothetical protein
MTKHRIYSMSFAKPEQHRETLPEIASKCDQQIVGPLP